MAEESYACGGASSEFEVNDSEFVVSDVLGYMTLD